jgi:methoxymalonate biosynthesis acyl carrier protein
MDVDEIKKKLKIFFKKFIGEVEIDEDENLFKSGLVNSLFAMQLVLYIEKEFTISIDRDDLDMKNFNSLNNITSFIKKKLV